MVKEEILVKLRSAEEENARRVAGAKDRAADVLKQARTEAERLIEVAREEARRAEEQRVADERKRLEKERDRILAEGAKQEQALRTAYQSKAQKHVEKALEGFERST